MDARPHRHTQNMSSQTCFFSIKKDRRGKFYNDRLNSPLPVAWLLSHPPAEVLNIKHLHDTRPNLFDKFFSFHHFIEQGTSAAREGGSIQETDVTTVSLGRL